MYQYHARRVNMNKYLPEGANNVLYLNFRLSEWRNVANVTLELPSLTPRTRKINVETKWTPTVPKIYIAYVQIN